MTDAGPIVCAWCGATAPSDEGVPLTWSTSVEGSATSPVTRYYCGTCSRENVRAIEGKLDTAWW